MNHDRSDEPNTPPHLVYLSAILGARVVPIDGGMHAIRLGTGDLFALHSSAAAMWAELRGAQRLARELAAILGAEELEELAPSARGIQWSDAARTQLREIAAAGAAAVVAAVTIGYPDGQRPPDWGRECGASCWGCANRIGGVHRGPVVTAELELAGRAVGRR